MRSYWRVPNKARKLVWVVVQTDANGFNDLVYLSCLTQVLQLLLGESPFFANFGIPAVQSVLQQVWPDYYVVFTQEQFAPFFASLQIVKDATALEPTYNIYIITHSGANLTVNVTQAGGVLATETGAIILTEAGQSIQV